MAELDWQRVRSLVGEALELAREERAAFLEHECAGDARLRAEVERLIAREGSADAEFLEPPEELTSDADEVGHRLGEFELLDEIGRGGMGVVYRARQASLARDVAVKVFVESLATTPQEIERFHREARAAARLRHPGIVHVLTDGQSGRTHWFAMELVEGHDIGRELQLQRRGSLPSGQRPILPPYASASYLPAIASLVAEVAEALHHAHTLGIVHRDVKPGNLLLQPDAHVQLVDFGLVRDEAQGSISRSGDLRGTPHYMSPEQARVRAVQVDHRTDVYSLGVVLYELATLHRPFEGGTSAEVITQIRERDPRPMRKVNPRVPRDLELVCNTAMAKELPARYRDSAAFAADLRRFLRGESVEAKAPTWTEHARRFVRRRRWVLSALVLLALGLALGANLANERARLRRLATLYVDLVDASGRPVAGSVFQRTIDPITGMPQPARALGKLPLRGMAVEPGYQRIVLRPEGGGMLEFARTLEAGRPLELVARARAQVPSDEGMVWIEGGVLALRDPGDLYSSLTGLDLEIAGFWLDATEVSNADYRRFLSATQHAPPPNWAHVLPGEHDDLPVVEVGWEDALAYAEWAEKRLPTYPEWTFAARGTESRIYPWADPVPGELRGNVLHPRLALAPAEWFPKYLELAAPVRSHPEACTPSGLFHMFGNVAEWTETPHAERKGAIFEPRPALRLLAGHAWDGGTKGLNLVYFAGHQAIERAYAHARVGFRCARSAAP